MAEFAICDCTCGHVCPIQDSDKENIVTVINIEKGNAYCPQCVKCMLINVFEAAAGDDSKFIGGLAQFLALNNQLQKL